MEFAGIVVLALLGAGIVWGILHHLRVQRTEAMKKVASRYGYLFTETTDPKSLPAFDLTSRSGSHAVRNSMVGEFQRVPFAYHEYEYTVGSGKNRRTYHQSIVIFDVAEKEIPPFTLDPENMLHKIASMFGYQDIDFATHPKFSSMYLLRGADELAIRNFFHDGRLGFFERHPGLYVEIHDGKLLFYRSGKRVAPTEFLTWLTEAYEVYALLASTGLRQLGD